MGTRDPMLVTTLKDQFLVVTRHLLLVGEKIVHIVAPPLVLTLRALHHRTQHISIIGEQTALLNIVL
jgi:hypothetical protein